MAIMKNQPTPSDHEVLTGLVERVTYAAQGPGPPRAVGHAAAISAGEWITASGSWVNDRTHGQQFKGRFLKTSAPTSVEGIEKYLASGMAWHDQPDWSTCCPHDPMTLLRKGALALTVC